jgi:hypothetical protein
MLKNTVLILMALSLQLENLLVQAFLQKDLTPENFMLKYKNLSFKPES